MIARRVYIALMIASTVAACRTGSTLDGVESARRPEGATAALHFLNGTPRRVELLSGNDSSLLVLHDGAVMRVAWRRLTRVTIGGLDTFTRPFSDASRTQILRVSRFPYGVSEDVLRQLLAAAEQTEVGVLE